MSKQQECNFNISYCQYDVKLIFCCYIRCQRIQGLSQKTVCLVYIFLLLKNLRRKCPVGVRTAKEKSNK